eukprot:5556817-Pleurochrysis_carterae.AAC.1
MSVRSELLTTSPENPRHSSQASSFSPSPFRLVHANHARPPPPSEHARVAPRRSPGSITDITSRTSSHTSAVRHSSPPTLPTLSSEHS